MNGRRCRVKDEKGNAMFACCLVSCWQASDADDCVSECCVKYGKCDYCEFGYLSEDSNDYLCELEQ